MMSENARPKVETNQSLFNRVIAQPLEKLIITAIIKLKGVWEQESALTGIQFYGDLDE
jgi:hypothetical protein